MMAPLPARKGPGNLMSARGIGAPGPGIVGYNRPA